MKQKRLGCLSVTGILTAVIALLVVAGVAYAGNQALFSPGTLNARTGDPLGGVASHAQIQDCAACHTAPLSSVHMADRCLACHTNVAQQMADPSTLHGAVQNATGETNCIVCHTEHHGALASLTDISMDTFPHTGLGFSLASHVKRQDGSHFVCADCHPSGYQSYTCDTCHRQIGAAFMQDHVFQYGTECLGCHDGVETVGASFDHAKTQFPLVGRHLSLLCAECHPDARTLVDLRAAPTACINCHAKDDPHGGRFGNDCASCHTADAWTPAKFDHSLARFQLTGGHVNVACQDCHKNGQFAGTPMDCASCHLADNPHADVYGTNCATCHNPNGWDQISFDHAQTGFVLSGAHTPLGCKPCHGSTPAAQMSATCGTCHAKDDPHGGQFGSNCDACHTTSAWKPSTFDHSRSNFPLTGAHTGLACLSCHKNGQFAGTPSTCGACHAKDDAHGGQFGTNCGACHTTNAWKPATFDHSLSNFPLTGAHAGLACTSCHKNGQFSGTSSACVSCHSEPAYHLGLFGTKCGSCHNTSNWSAKYTGPHPNIDDGRGTNHHGASCRDCHTKTLSSATCTKCHDSNNPGDGGGDGGGGGGGGDD